MNFKRITFGVVFAVLAVGPIASSGHAQGITFGGTAASQLSGDPAARDGARRAARKTNAQMRTCRLERHQVYNAQSQLIWKTIRVCG